MAQNQKAKLVFYLVGGKSMNYKQSVKKIQAGIEEKLAAAHGCDSSDRPALRSAVCTDYRSM